MPIRPPSVSLTRVEAADETSCRLKRTSIGGSGQWERCVASNQNPILSDHLINFSPTQYIHVHVHTTPIFLAETFHYGNFQNGAQTSWLLATKWVGRTDFSLHMSVLSRMEPKGLGSWSPNGWQVGIFSADSGTR